MGFVGKSGRSFCRLTTAGLFPHVARTFISPAKRAGLPWLPTSLILRDKYDNIAALARHPGPVAIVIAEEDEVVGAAQGRKLYDNYPGKKILIPLPDTGHNSLPTHPSAEWFQRISDFLLSGSR